MSIISASGQLCIGRTCVMHKGQQLSFLQRLFQHLQPSCQLIELPQPHRVPAPGSVLLGRQAGMRNHEQKRHHYSKTNKTHTNVHDQSPPCRQPVACYHDGPRPWQTSSFSYHWPYGSISATSVQQGQGLEARDWVAGWTQHRARDAVPTLGLPCRWK